MVVSAKGYVLRFPVTMPVSSGVTRLRYRNPYTKRAALPQPF